MYSLNFFPRSNIVISRNIGPIHQGGGCLRKFESCWTANRLEVRMESVQTFWSNTASWEELLLQHLLSSCNDDDDDDIRKKKVVTELFWINCISFRRSWYIRYMIWSIGSLGTIGVHWNKCDKIWAGRSLAERNNRGVLLGIGGLTSGRGPQVIWGLRRPH